MPATMHEESTNEQLRLFFLDNPLKERFGSSFFKPIPITAGVYWMLDENDVLLYVGKAKNLRARLKSYRHLKFAEQSPKKRRLLSRVRSIHWHDQPDETSALLTENSWLRALKPPCNVVNIRPEDYLFLGYRQDLEQIELRLLFNEVESEREGFQLAGPFKGIAQTRRAHSSLVRWLWASVHDNCDWPPFLSRIGVPFRSVISTVGVCGAHLEQVDLSLRLFLAGLAPLIERVLPEEEPKQFLQSLWLADQMKLERFFSSCKRLKLLRERFGLHDRTLRQNELDDLIVLRRSLAMTSQDSAQGILSEMSGF